MKTDLLKVAKAIRNLVAFFLSPESGRAALQNLAAREGVAVMVFASEGEMKEALENMKVGAQQRAWYARELARMEAASGARH